VLIRHPSRRRPSAAHNAPQRFEALKRPLHNLSSRSVGTSPVSGSAVRPWRNQGMDKLVVIRAEGEREEMYCRTLRDMLEVGHDENLCLKFVSECFVTIDRTNWYNFAFSESFWYIGLSTGSSEAELINFSHQEMREWQEKDGGRAYCLSGSGDLGKAQIMSSPSHSDLHTLHVEIVLSDWEVSAWINTRH
jgi:hypothetical protein